MQVKTRTDLQKMLDREELLRIKSMLTRLHEIMDDDLAPSTTTTDRIANRIDKQIARIDGRAS